MKNYNIKIVQKKAENEEKLTRNRDERQKINNNIVDLN